jgi:hypothetical protein
MGRYESDPALAIWVNRYTRAGYTTLFERPQNPGCANQAAGQPFALQMPGPQ